MRMFLAVLLCLLPAAHAEEFPDVTVDSPTASQDALSTDGNAFAADLYGQLKTQPGNLFFSPESLSTALAMAYAGARGDTAAAIAKTLHFTLPPEQLHSAIGAVLKDWNSPHANYQLSVANALWAQRGIPFLPDFLKLMQDDYGAAAQEVDFRGATEAARMTINRWVEQKTADKIKDLLQPGTIKSATRLVLTNAIYFKGDWMAPFDTSQTKDEAFHTSSAKSVQTPLMHRTGNYRYYDGGAFQALEIAYKGNELSMVILLPKEVEGLAALEQSLSAATLQRWLEDPSVDRKVILTLPKFRMTRQVELAHTLGAMGMAQAFGESADFSGITGKRDFAISAVIHKAYVDVNETGTEAAAATAVTMRAMAMPRRDPEPPPVFRADHPFLFLIRDVRSKSVLFMGRLEDPSA